MTIRTFTIVPTSCVRTAFPVQTHPEQPVGFPTRARAFACLLLLLTGVPMLALPFNQAIAQGPTSAQNLTGETDTDGDGLSDFQERHKYRTDLQGRTLPARALPTATARKGASSPTASAR